MSWGHSTTCPAPWSRPPYHSSQAHRVIICQMRGGLKGPGRCLAHSSSPRRGYSQYTKDLAKHQRNSQGPASLDILEFCAWMIQAIQSWHQRQNILRTRGGSPPGHPCPHPHSLTPSPTPMNATAEGLGFQMLPSVPPALPGHSPNVNVKRHFWR